MLAKPSDFQYTYTHEVYKLVAQLEKDLQYPHCENDKDRKGYVAKFEATLIKLLK